MAKQKRTPQASRDPDLLGRLWQDTVLSLRLMFDRRIGGGVKLIPLGVLLYMLSPLDFLPDILLPFGIVDDLGVFVLGLQMFIRSAPREVVDEYRGIRKPTPPAQAPGTPPTVDGGAPYVIEGHYEVLDDGWDDYSADEDSDDSAYQNHNPRWR